MAVLSPPPKLQFFDANGVPLAGGKLYSYAAGTTTPLATYTSSAETTFNTNPIILNSRGEAEVWLGSPLYKFKLTTAADVEIWTVDNIFSLAGLEASLKAYYAASDGSSKVGFIQAGAGAVTRTSQAKMRETVSVFDFMTEAQRADVVSGVFSFDASPAFTAAVASLPATGGTLIVPDGGAYRLDSTVTDGGKAVRFQIGVCTIQGPQTGWAFDLQKNGTSFRGAGRGSTILKLRPPTSPSVMPTATATITAGVVTAVTINTVGSNLWSTPVCQVSGSPTFNDAAFVPETNPTTRVLATLSIVPSGGGSGYVTAPTVSFLGGGCGAIKSNEIQGSHLSGFTVDMNNVPHAVGVYHYGGWYADFSEIEFFWQTTAPTAIGLVIDSHTLGVPGPTGSYGGVYVCYYRSIDTTRVYVVGHQTSLATTLSFETLDCENFWAVNARDFTFTNPVLQGSTGYMLDLAEIDNVLLNGGDVEVSATIFRTRSTVNNVRVFGTRRDAHTGVGLYGNLGRDWSLDWSDSSRFDEWLRTGTNGSAGLTLQNTNWNVKHRFGVPYSGDQVVFASNIKLISATQGNLDDVASGGFALILDAAGRIRFKSATSGANPRTLVDIAEFTAGGFTLSILNSSNPGAGSKKIWYDPADGNRVKFAP